MARLIVTCIRLPLTALILCAVTWPLAAADELGDAVRSAIDRVSPSVVRIQIVGSPDRAGKVVSRITTAVVVSDDGHLVSSSFGFASDSASIIVQTHRGERHSAKVIATDHVRKLTLLKADALELQPPVWSDRQPSVGAWSVATGRFYATKRPTAALGVISALNRVHGLAIQTDAKVSPINYGGPLIDLEGRVTGILVPLSPANEATGVSAGVEWYDSGIGFAIPAADVLDSVQRLKTGDSLQHGLLGISLTSKNPLSADVIVEGVHPGSPAETSGLQAGDRILMVNDRLITRLGLLQGALKSAWAGDTMILKLERGDEQPLVEVTLTDALKNPERGWLGFVPLANQHGADDDDGADGTKVALAGVISGSPAESAGLPNPCLISKIGDNEIQSVKDLRRALSDVADGSTWEITFAVPDQPTAAQTATVAAGIRPADMAPEIALDIAAVRETAIADQQPEWTQAVLDLQEDRHAWVYGPADSVDGVELGVVMILSDGKPVAEELLQQWREVCGRDQLVLVVVYHEFGLPTDSLELLGGVMNSIAARGQIDPDRIALVTTESHASFVTRMLLSPRIRLLRAAVYLNCRPVTAGISLATVTQKRVSIMMAAEEGTAEEIALLSSTADTLRSAGAAVRMEQTTPDDRTTLPREIARWMLLQKIR